MNQNKKSKIEIDESLEALNKAFNEMSESDMNALINRVDAMPFEGPTINEYFDNFDSNFIDIFDFDGYEIPNSHVEIMSYEIERLDITSIIINSIMLTGVKDDRKEPVKCLVKPANFTLEEFSGVFY